MARLIFIAAGLLVAAWLAGLLVFVGDVSTMIQRPVHAGLESTDAIVVLTGGSERIEAGLELLKAGRGKKLFISGVYPGLTLDRLIGSYPVPKKLRECCIVLGHAAETTIGNAEETLAWMGIEHYRSMQLVTSNYHMRRSLMVFHAAMPDIEIIPHPVAPESVKLNNWWRWPGTASLLVTEYNKYLFAMIELWLRQP